MKPNGPVAAKGADSVIDYRVEQLDISTHTTKREKQAALGVLFLYSVVFGGIDQPGFDSIQMWEKRVLPQFQGSNEQAKQQAFVRMQGWIPSTVGPNLGKLTSLLRGLVARPTPFVGYQYPVRLVVRRALLQSDPAEMAPSNSFFKPVLNVDSGRRALKYISVHSVDESRDDELISIIVNISLFDTRCFPRAQPETFQMQYDIEGIKNLSILFAPEGRYERAFSQYRAIVFSYKSEEVKALLDSEVNQGFHYQFCFVDLSAFYVASGVALSDPRDPDKLREQLKAQNHYRRSKSAFAKLKIDGNIQDFFVHEDFAQYYKAFITQDKETAKLIQAGSYAESFWRFFNFGDRPVQFNILGYSDRGVSSLALDQKNIAVLETCAYIYKNRTQETPEAACERVVSQIRYNAYRNFDNGREFIKDILDPLKNGALSHTEVLEGFFNPCNTLKDHNHTL